LTTAAITLMLPVGSDPGSDAPSVIELARRAEDAGFSAVSLSDHVVMGPRVDRYPWGEFPYPPSAPWVEPLTVMSAIATVTTRIRLTTGILIVPLRPAALLAKWVATIDAISGGRLELGVGTGWQEEEFDAVGADYARRGQALTDGIAACRALWSSWPATFSSPTVSFTDIWCEPRPVRPGGPPVLFSGTLTSRNLRRIVELGDGWIPIMGERRAGISDGVAILQERYRAAGRDPSTLRVRSVARIGRTAAGAAGGERPDVAATIEGAPILIAAGVTDIDLPMNLFVNSEDEFDSFFATAARAIAAASWIRRG